MEHQHLSRNISGRGWNLLPELKEILEILKELPLKDALFYLVYGLKLTDYAVEGGARIKQIIQDKFNRKQYAFVPDKEEANLLKSFRDQSEYRQVSMLVPFYRHIDIIRTGLLIDYYHRNDSTENREKVERIKKQLIKRPNGEKLLKIANLPTTPFFKQLLQLLYNLKSEGYTEVQLEEKFDELVERWDKITMLVKTTDSVDDAVHFCETQIFSGSPLFFICGMKSASNIVEASLVKLQEDDFLENRGYKGLMTKDVVGNNPRTEIMFVKMLVA